MTNPIDDGLVVVETISVGICTIYIGDLNLVALDNARAMIAKARKDALEEAAKICELCGYDSIQGARDIRALAEKEEKK